MVVFVAWWFFSSFSSTILYCIREQTIGKKRGWIYVCHWHADTSNVPIHCSTYHSQCLILFPHLFLLHLLVWSNLPLSPLTYPAFIWPLFGETDHPTLNIMDVLSDLMSVLVSCCKLCEQGWKGGSPQLLLTFFISWVCFPFSVTL